MKNFVRVMENIPVKDILEEIKENSLLWDKFTFRQDFEGSPHKHTKCIPLRVPVIQEGDVITDVLDTGDTDFCDYFPNLIQMIRLILSRLPTVELGRIMIVSLKPEGVIDEHIDEGLYAEYYNRMHLVIKSKKGNEFFCGNEQVHMEDGQVWFFNHRENHSFVNKSDEERIHVIIDLKLDEGGD